MSMPTINAGLAIQNFNAAQGIINKIISNPKLQENPMDSIEIGGVHHTLSGLLPTLQALSTVAQASGIQLQSNYSLDGWGGEQKLLLRA